MEEKDCGEGSFALWASAVIGFVLGGVLFVVRALYYPHKSVTARRYASRQ